MSADAAWKPSTPRRVAAIFASLMLPGAGQVLLGGARWAPMWLLLQLLSMGLAAKLGPIAVLMVLLTRLGSGVHAALQRGSSKAPDPVRTAVLCFALFLGMMTAMASLKRDVVENISLPTASMYPTLEAGDYVVIDKAAYGWRLPFTSSRVGKTAVRPGDVVAFDDPEHADQLLLGRVLVVGPGRAGEPAIERRAIERPCTYLTFDDKGKFVDVPCARFEETIGGRSWQIVEAPGKTSVLEPIDVPAGSVAVIADNRSDAKLQVVKAETVRGKASVVWFSTAGPRGVRWGRIGERVK